MEIMIVIFGSLYFLVRIVGEEIYGRHIEKKSARCKRSHEALRHKVVSLENEQITKDFVRRLVVFGDNLELLDEVVGDNLSEIYGDNYWEELKKSFTRDPYDLLSSHVEYLVIWLIMSKEGYVPAYWYDNDWTVYLLQKYQNQAKLEFRYFGQIQKNYDMAGCGLQLIQCRDPRHNSERIVKFRHQFVHPSIARGKIRYKK